MAIDIKTIMEQDLETRKQRFGFRISAADIRTGPLIPGFTGENPKDMVGYSYLGTVFTDCKDEAAFSAKFKGEKNHLDALYHIFENLEAHTSDELIACAVMASGGGGMIDGVYVGWDIIHRSSSKEARDLSRGRNWRYTLV